MFMSYYEILGIPKTSTQDEIKKAYRNLCKKYHPDVSKEDNSETKFKEIQEAYEVLSEESKRQQYDRFGTPDGGNRFQSHGFNMEDIFSQFGDIFGHNPYKNQVRRGQDLKVQLNITLEDVFSGGSKKIRYRRQTPCKPCSGKGGTDLRNCSACRGTGQRTMSQQTPFGMFQQTTPCGECNQTGKKVNNQCRTCSGSGTTPTDEIIEINLPIGVSGGMTFRMSGYGNHVRDGQPGDLHISINEQIHPKFRREGNDIHCDEWITVPDAVLGTEIKIDTLSGPVLVEVGPGCESGRTFTFRGKGTPVSTSTGQHYGNGNLFVKVNVTIPKDPTEKEKELYQQIKELTK